jgi:hypothetical protein
VLAIAAAASLVVATGLKVVEASALEAYADFAAQSSLPALLLGAIAWIVFLLGPAAAGALVYYLLAPRMKEPLRLVLGIFLGMVFLLGVPDAGVVAAGLTHDAATGFGSLVQWVRGGIVVGILIALAYMFIRRSMQGEGDSTEELSEPS